MRLMPKGTDMFAGKHSRPDGMSRKDGFEVEKG